MKKPLVEFITEYLSENALELPVFHAVALKLQQLLAHGTYSINEVAQLIVADQALASRMLRIANSPFYSGLSTVSTIRDAIVRLGAQEVANIAMVATQQDVYRSGNEAMNRYMKVLWNHSLGCAIGTKWLATKTGFRNIAQEAFLAALLHDIGKLFLLKVLDELGRSERNDIKLTDALIREVFDSLHTRQGYVLMQKWNLPETFCRIVRDHHLTSDKSDDMYMALVRLTNLTCRKIGIGMTREPNLVLFTTEEAQFLGVKEIVLAELEIIIEDSTAGETA